MSRAILAVDAGGTSTRAMVVAPDSTCLAETRGGPGNPRSSAIASQTIARVSHEAIDAAGTSPRTVVITMAGLVSLGGAHPETVDALRAVGVECPVRLVTDLHGIYFSATDAPSGAVLLAGTGATAAFFEQRELTSLRDGLGWLLGDAGAGFWMGREVARAVAAELDHRGPLTSLTQRALNLVSSSSPTPPRSNELAAFIAWAYEGRPVDLAQLAVMAAEESPTDAVAADICSRAASHLIETLSSLPVPHGSPVVLGGSVLGPTSPVGDIVRDYLGPRAVHARDGLTGAAVLALRTLGSTPDRSRIEATRPIAAIDT